MSDKSQIKWPQNKQSQKQGALVAVLLLGAEMKGWYDNPQITFTGYACHEKKKRKTVSGGVQDKQMSATITQCAVKVVSETESYTN